MAQAFLSYAHVTDVRDDGAVEKLCSSLENEMQVHGVPFVILRDRKHINWGQRWREFMDNAATEAIFLLPILTEAYFDSKPCYDEYASFKKKEDTTGTKDLMLPLLYADVNERDDSKPKYVREWRADVFSRQYFDWRPYRFDGPKAKAHKSAISQISIQLKLALRGRDIKGPLIVSTRSLNRGQADQPGVRRRITTAGGRNFPPHLVSSAPARGQMKYERELLDHYSHLTGTQKLLLKYIYTEMQRNEISLEELLRIFTVKHAEKIDSASEMFFRLRDLQHQHFLRLESVGDRATIIITEERVKRAAISRQLFKT